MARANGRDRTRRNVSRSRIDRHKVDIMALRDLGLSYRAISAALKHFRNAEVTEHQVNYALARWGEEPMRSKDRTARAHLKAAA